MQNKTASELRKLLSNNKKQAPSCAPFSKMKKADLVKYVALLGLQDTPMVEAKVTPKQLTKSVAPMIEAKVAPMIEAKVTPMIEAKVTPTKKQKPADALVNELTALKNEMGPFDLFKALKGRRKKHFAYIDKYGKILEKYRLVQSAKADKIARDISRLLEQQQEYLNIV
jgi:hypothetical protein